jgi:hypothetical protein
VSFGGWYFYDQHKSAHAWDVVSVKAAEEWKKDPVVSHAPPCKEDTVFPNTVDHCAPWDRKWAKTDTVQAGATIEDDGRITSPEENRKAMDSMPVPSK